MTAPADILVPTLTQGHTLDWSPGTTYQPNMDVFDRGGIWRCVVENKGSQPISGNTDWALVAGMPYTDVSTTAAEYPLLFSAPKLVVPAPGASLAMFVTGIVLSWVSGLVINTDTNQSFKLFYGTSQDPTTAASDGLNPITDELGITWRQAYIVNGIISVLLYYPTTPVDNINKAVYLANTVADITGQDGLRTLTLASGGTGYAIGDLVGIDGGSNGYITVKSVGGGGAIVTFVIGDVPGSGSTGGNGSGYSVASGVATTALTGVGTGATVNITSVGDADATMHLRTYYQIASVA